MITMKKILIPVDFSEYSKKALNYALEFAQSYSCEIIAVYVVEPVIYPADFSFGQVAIPSMENELRQRGVQHLEKLLETVNLHGVATRAVVRSGKPFLEIIQLAREEQVDLIIIATHGHTGIEHVLFGSTAEKVVRKASCPVLVVRDKEKEFISEG